MTIEETFGIAVKNRRLELGISQEELARIAGLHRTYIGSIERGERNVSLLNIMALCGALDILPSALVHELDNFIKPRK